MRVDPLAKLLADELGVELAIAWQVARGVCPRPRWPDRGHAGSNRPVRPKAVRQARRKAARESRRRNRK